MMIEKTSKTLFLNYYGPFLSKIGDEKLSEKYFHKKIKASQKIFSWDTGLFKIHGIVKDSQKFVKHSKGKLFKKYRRPDFFTHSSDHIYSLC